MSKQAALFLLLVVFQQHTISSYSLKATIVKAKAKTKLGSGWAAGKVRDNDVTTFYHSNQQETEPQWLRLTLAEEYSKIEKVVIINRYNSGVADHI